MFLVPRLVVLPVVMHQDQGANIPTLRRAAGAYGAEKLGAACVYFDDAGPMYQCVTYTQLPLQLSLWPGSLHYPLGKNPRPKFLHRPCPPRRIELEARFCGRRSLPWRTTTDKPLC